MHGKNMIPNSPLYRVGIDQGTYLLPIDLYTTETNPPKQAPIFVKIIPIVFDGSSPFLKSPSLG